MIHRFQWRTSLISMLFLLAAIASLAYAINLVVQNSCLEDWKQGLTLDAQSLSDQAEIGISAGPPYSILSALTNDYAQDRGLSLTILLADGTILSQPGDASLQIANPGALPEVASALDGQGSAQLRAISAQEEMLSIGEPVMQNGEVIGAVLLAASSAGVDAKILNLEKQIVFIAVLVFLGALLLAVLANRASFRPFHELVRRVSLAAVPGMEKSTSLLQADEIRQLDRAFHQLVSLSGQQASNLEAERNTLEKILDNMTDSILILDAEGMIQMINPAACILFNSSKTQALGHSISSVVRHYQLVDLWKESQSSGVQQSTTLEIGPNYRFIQGIAAPLVSKDMPEKYLLVFQDLTRLRRLENVRRDFVSNVSHELRTPLASIKALVETLSSGAIDDPPAAQRFLTRMENEVDNMAQIVQELLELSRIESGKVPLEKGRVNPSQLLQSAVERMQVQAERAHLTLSIQCPPDLPDVNADRSRIGQVLINLLHNAIKFTPPGGSILATAHEENVQIVFSIKDSGIGMEPRVLERIFERFYKADRARSSDGTGLGLSIARHLVEAHGGQIWAESEINRGSTFFFSLPKI